MVNPFSKIAHGVVWLGKEIAKPFHWVPKVLTVTKDVAADAKVLLPQVISVFEDVDALALAAIKDGGADLLAADDLVAAIMAAAKSDGLNIAADEAVLTALKAFAAKVTAKGTYGEMIAAVQKLVKDYDTFGASAKAAIAKIEQDVK
jgi:hypothetical protein